MIPAEIIARKRDHHELTEAEIAFFIHGYAQGDIADAQMSALAMAIFLNGMTTAETACLTQQMLDSGTRLAWPDDGIPRVDKHSTGGVGDKVSLPLAPLLACCDLQVPMLSGRGLGPTGGTLDKLESHAGFRTDLSLDEMTRLTQEVGCVITGASAELAPADRKLYELRDVTGTVPCIPLITASIMSKKLAESLDALVLDVKFGSGAFMQTYEQAVELAESLVRTGGRMGVSTTAMLTDMNQPLGRMCGNAVEMLESLDTLRGEGPADVRQLTLELAADLLLSTGRQASRDAAMQVAADHLDSGRAMEKFEQMIVAQGGRRDFTYTVAPAVDVPCRSAGVVSHINTQRLGLAVIAMKGGRQQQGDQLDHSTGFEMLVRVGDTVEAGQPLVKLFCREPEPAASMIQEAITIGTQAAPLPLIRERLSSATRDG